MCESDRQGLTMFSRGWACDLFVLFAQFQQEEARPKSGKPIDKTGLLEAESVDRDGNNRLDSNKPSFRVCYLITTQEVALTPRGENTSRVQMSRAKEASEVDFSRE